MFCFLITILFSVGFGFIILAPVMWCLFAPAILPWGVPIETAAEILLILYLFVKWNFQEYRKALGIMTIIAAAVVAALMALEVIPNIFLIMHEKIDWWVLKHTAYSF